MSTHRKLVEDYLAAATRQDVAAMRAAFATDMVYRVPGRSLLAGTTTGQDAALEYYRRIMAMSGGTYRILSIEDWLESPDRIALIAREAVTVKGRSLEWTRIVVFRFRDDRISEVTLFDDDLYALDDVLGG